jgi:hypothetical protein
MPNPRIEPGRNAAWCALTALLGDWGGIVGWPFFICLAIGVGNLAGLWRGEWSGAPRTARVKLNLGLALLVLAGLVIALSSVVKTP